MRSAAWLGPRASADEHADRRRPRTWAPCTSRSPISSARSTTTATSIGLAVLEQGDGRATLGVGDTRLLELIEVPGALPAPGRTGLFHFALLLPDRRSLALWVAHAVRERVRLAGASDHFVSEAIYLSDPDRHGIEIYADRPRALWEGKVAERHGHRSARSRRAAGRARRPGLGAVRRPARRHDDGPCPPAGLAGPAEHRVLPRRRSASA